MVLMSLQNCTESLLFNPILPIRDIAADQNFLESINIIERVIMAFYSLAMVVAPFVDILIIYSVLDSVLHLYVWVGKKKRNILIVGYNDNVKNIIERKNENGKIFLWTEHILPSEEERYLYLKKVSVVMNDFSLGDNLENYSKQKKKFNVFLKKKRITDILLVDKSDVKNNQYYMALSSCDMCKTNTIHFYVHSDTFEDRNMLQDYFDAKLNGLKKAAGDHSEDQNTHMDLQIFNFDQIQAEEMFSKLPIYTGKEDCKEQQVHILIAGGNSLCMYTALHAMNQAVFSPDNNIIIDIVNDSIDGIQRGLSERFDKGLVECNENEFIITPSKIDGSLRIRLKACQLRRSDLAPVLRELQDSESGKFTYIALLSRIVEENLHVFRCIDEENLISDKRGIPVAMRLAYSEEMYNYLCSFGWCSALYLMGQDEDYIGVDQIVNPEKEKCIREYHAAYTNVCKEKIDSTGSTPNMPDERERLWNSLEYYKRQANRALYLHKDIKETFFIDCKDEMNNFMKEDIAGKGNDRARILSGYLKDESKYPKLHAEAQTEHRRWAYFLASEGWKYSEEKDPKKRTHDCLCNWRYLKEKRPDVLIYDLISSPLLCTESFGDENATDGNLKTAVR